MKIVKKQSRKKVSNEKKGTKPTFNMKSKCYFLTYKGISDFGQKITKQGLAHYLLHQNSNDIKVKPKKYLICEQMYDSGQPHFHCILTYDVRKEIISQNFYDYLGIHPNIQTMRNMKAALQYVYKEDPHPYTNMNIAQEQRIAKVSHTSSLYDHLYDEMIKDPFNFDPIVYCNMHNLTKQIYKASYTKALHLLKLVQPAYCRQLLRNKPGIKFITPTLIRTLLSEEEFTQYNSDPCYQKIIDHINQIYTYPNTNHSTKAPLKTKHLLITGLANTGKTSLIYDHGFRDPYPGLAHYYPTYYLSVGQRYFPPYSSFDYRLVNWEQFTIDSDIFPKKGYNRLLNYLDGSVSALPQKGRPPVQRQDNPKHILTSNRTLTQHIFKTFISPQSRAMALNNLPARIDNVVIPAGKNIHFLRKLFVPLV